MSAKSAIRVISQFIVPALCVLVGAGVLVGVAALSYEAAYAWLSQYSSDGKLEFLTLAIFQSITTKLRLAGAALVAVGAALFWFRAAFYGAVWQVVQALAGIGRGIGRSAQTFWRTETQAHLLVLAVVLAAGAVLRIAHLGAPMRSDESYSYLNFSSKPLLIGLSSYIVPNNHLLHTVFTHWLTQVFGSAPQVLRLPAVGFGIGLIAVTYWFGRVVASRPAATLAAALVAVSFPLIEFSINARGYSMLHVFSLVVFGLVYKLRAHPRLALYLALVLTAVAGLWTVPVFLAALGAAALWYLQWLVRQPAAERTRRLLVAVAMAVAVGVLTVLLYAPILVTMGPDAIIANDFVKPLPLAQVLAQLPSELPLAGGFLVQGLPPLALALLGVGLAAALLLGWARFAALVSLTLIAVGWSVVFVLLIHKFPPPRVHYFLVPLLYLTAAAGWDALLTRLLGARRSAWPMAASAVAVGVVVLTTAYLLARFDRYRFTPLYEQRDGEAVLEYLRHYKRPTDRVVLSSNSAPIMGYYSTRRPVPKTIRPPGAPDERLLVVYYPLRNLPFAFQLAQAQTDTVGFGPRRLIHRFNGSLLYQYDRLRSATVPDRNK